MVLRIDDEVRANFVVVVVVPLAVAAWCRINDGPTNALTARCLAPVAAQNNNIPVRKFAVVMLFYSKQIFGLCLLTNQSINESMNE
mmetsp:Transcript_3299/g.9149  ORF Transcript_3299/g.9149 Transcript_3299/m.9149 type:complete len:86 (+) Transcript_3299:2022-2279(+)